MSMERSKAGMNKNRSPACLSLNIQNTIIKSIICQYFIRYRKKKNKIQLTKNKTDFNNPKNYRHGRRKRGGHDPHILKGRRQYHLSPPLFE